MIEFRKCYPEHILLINAQATQQSEYAAGLSSTAMGEAAYHGVSMSAWVNHRPVAAAGLFPKWKHNAIAWALLSDGCGRHMPAIARKMRDVINSGNYRRVEMSVLHGFEPAYRLARALGFKMEAPLMECYDPDGRDMALFSLVQR